MSSVIHLPNGIQRHLDAALRTLLDPRANRGIDFARPAGEPALVPADSVSWRVFKNPVALFIGGVAAVLLELAEPSVCAGVWDHSSFRRDPLGRLQRTGLAAMVTVYGARSVAEPMIARIARLHSTIVGTTPEGISYCAGDPRLLTWVHATAAFSFAHAYHRYVEPLGAGQLGRLYLEGTTASRLYGAIDAPATDADMSALIDSMRGGLRPAPALFEFLRIIRDTPAFPRALGWLQPLLVRAAVDLVPGWIRDCLGLREDMGLRRRDRWLVTLAAELSNRIVLVGSPAAQSCTRLGLPASYLYDRPTSA